MSLQTLKETLKPCSNPSSSSFQSNKTHTETSIYPSFDPSISRKPPKSSLSQQLLRLEDSFFLPPIQPQSLQKRTNELVVGDDEEEEEEEETEPKGFVRAKISSHFQFDHTGPFEPLILSLQGEMPVVQVPASINCRLLEHQRVGVKFLYGLYKNNHGGILGDDMGLGKTIQTIAFLAAVFGKDGDTVDSHILKKNQPGKKDPVLIVCPTSVIHNWESEFSKWSNFSVSVYHGANRDLIFDKLEAHGVEILITSFDTYRIHGSILSEVKWETVIVDEAHRLKNEKSKLYRACLEIKTLKRYGLTGTIMQNKIMELFNLFDWVAPGSLGTREHFREFYDEPLKHGQRSSAPERFVKVADKRKQHLVVVLHKYLLRRTKEETIGHLMMGKEDNVVFCTMSELQRRVYRRMLQLPDIQCLINKDLPCSCGSPLTQAECCKRIVPNGSIWPYLHRDNPDGCDSCPYCLVLPCLVKLQQVSNHLELIKPNPKDDPEKQKKDAEFASSVFGSDIDMVGGNMQNESFMGLSDVKHCGKMRALEKLLCSWILQGDKVLLFSYSVRMLDILEKFLIRKGYCFSRLDGSTPTNLRQSLVDDFNSSPSKQVFLISTRAGGLGLNLVSANRVVIFDPNWNPAQDLQAQDRSFRFGQRRHVVVFRLLAAGSLEELVYSRQVYKQQLANIAVSGKMEKRYFEGVQDCKEFQGELFGICNLFRDLSDKLFTSEIIDLHEKQQQEHGLHHSEKQELTKLGNSLIPSKEFGPASSSGSEIRITSDSKKASTSTPVLEDLGIVYAHRYEDIVNLGPGIQGKLEEEGIPQHDSPRQSIIHAARRKKPDGITKQENNAAASSSSDGRKRAQFSLLAKFMGMGEIEFCKWLISATPFHCHFRISQFRIFIMQSNRLLFLQLFFDYLVLGITDHMEIFGDMGELAAEKHVEYILSVEKKKDSFESVVMEHLRMNGAYWGLTTLDLLGKLHAVDVDQIVSWIIKCQHDSGGFGGNIGHDPHVLYTLSAVQVLALFDKLDVLDIEKVSTYVAGLQNEDGSFSGDMWGEIDTRFSYIAICCLSLLHRLDKINVENAVSYIVSCKNLDGGFGCMPGGESHAGQIFCCVGALAITGALHHIDKDLLGWWLCERQVKSGGLNGRPEKLPDVCYSWWVLSSLIMIDRVHWINKEKLVKYILDCQDLDNGGISDRPDDAVDVYHTYFGVAGLSLLEYTGLKAIDPAYALPVDVVNRIFIGRQSKKES